MKRHLLAILLMLFVINAYSENMTQPLPTDDTHLAALRAIGVADIMRNLIEADCKYSAHAEPAFYAKLCSNLPKVSNEAINQFALPLARSALSSSDAQSALSFFSTPSGQSIAKNLSRNEINTLTESELTELSKFNNSSAGNALHGFLGDPNLLPTLIEAISRYVP